MAERGFSGKIARDFVKVRAFYGRLLGCPEGRSSAEWIDFDLFGHQIVAQLNKLIDVVTVEDMTGGEHIERELVLLKLKVLPEQADAVRGYVVRSGGRVLDPASDGFIVELTASESEVDAFVAELGKGAQLLEVVRSGALGISRLAKEARSRRE